MALLSLSSCATLIHDHTYCSPIPGGYGAVCDNFLTHKPQTLNQAEWLALQDSWMSKGWAVECTESNAVGDLKAEIEKLCSKTACDQDTSKTLQNLIQILVKVQTTGSRAMNQ